MTVVASRPRDPMAGKASPSRYLLVMAIMQCKLKKKNSSHDRVSMKILTGAHFEGELHEKLRKSLSFARRLKKGCIRARSEMAQGVAVNNQ